MPTSAMIWIVLFAGYVALSIQGLVYVATVNKLSLRVLGRETVRKSWLDTNVLGITISYIFIAWVVGLMVQPARFRWVLTQMLVNSVIEDPDNKVTEEEAVELRGVLSHF